MPGKGIERGWAVAMCDLSSQPYVQGKRERVEDREGREKKDVLLSIIKVQHFLEAAEWEEKKWDPATDSFLEHFLLMSSQSNLADKRPEESVMS